MAEKAPAQAQQKSGGNIFASLVVPIAFAVALLIYMFVFGNPSNFVGGDPNNHPVSEGFGKWLGTIHKGGIIVPVLLTLFLIVITFVIERFLTISKASGTGSPDAFVRRVKFLLETGDVDSALKECDKQKGSVGNVVRAGLLKYKAMEVDHSLDKDQKILAIQKELEEATTLELPMLEQNLVFLATIANVSTLMGLFGTVLGMIRAFSALSNAGAPDSTALATGISEALINTALGIGTSAIAIIMYNFFTTKIDGLTYRIDEIGYSIVQTFAAKNK